MLYRGHRYKEVKTAAIRDDFWRGEQLLFWIYCVVDSKTGTDLPAKAKRLTAKTWNKMPEEIRQGVGDDVDQQAKILECVERGTCQYICIEGLGWNPGAKKGAADVALVQATLEWIQQSRGGRGSKLIWAEITSQVKRAK